MISFRRQNSGLSILEVLLVLAIATLIVVLGLRQYYVYQIQANVYQVQYNVDLLFQSMAQYFRANCADKNGPFFTPSASFAVTVSTLQNEGYLSENLVRSPLLNNDPPDYGYVLQFNPVTPPPSRVVKLSSGGEANVGRIILWRAQVAVNLQNPATAQEYSQMLLADCLSDQVGEIVAPCDRPIPPPSTGYSFAVFQRLPSLSSSAENSELWPSNPLVKQFTQMYTTDPILVLTDQTLTKTQTYRCTN